MSTNVLRCFAPSLCLKGADQGTRLGQGQGQGQGQDQGQGQGLGQGQMQGQGQGRLDYKCHLWITTQLVSLTDRFYHILLQPYCSVPDVYVPHSLSFSFAFIVETSVILFPSFFFLPYPSPLPPLSPFFFLLSSFFFLPYPSPLPLLPQSSPFRAKY